MKFFKIIERVTFEGVFASSGTTTERMTTIINLDQISVIKVDLLTIHMQDGKTLNLTLKSLEELLSYIESES